MKRMAGLGVMLALALVQVTWAPRLSIAGAFPNLVLAAVVGITWTYGVRPGLVWACVGGFLLDLTASGPIGPHALALLGVAYAASIWARNVETAHALHAALTAAAGTAVYSLTLVLTDGVLGMPAIDLLVVVKLTVAAALYNAVLGAVVLQALSTMRTTVREASRTA